MFAKPMPACRALFVAWVAALVVVAAPVSADDAAPETLIVAPGFHKLLRSPGPVARVAIGDPRVADVNVINQREILIDGKVPGVTSLMVWPKARPGQVVDPKQYRLSVGPGPSSDPDLAGMNLTPGAPVEGTAPSLLAHGRALSSEPAGDGKTPIVDRSVIGGLQQVQSQVRIVEVNRSALQEYGFNFFKSSGRYGGLAAPSTLSSVTPGSGMIASSTGFLPLSNAFSLFFGNSDYAGILNLLESKGLARTLAEPSLTAMSGQTASFLAGGEFPYPVPQGSGGGGTTVTIQFREFGVRLNLTPTVLSPDRIALKIAPEVSELDFSNAVTIQGTTVPGLIVRRTDTTVELGDGETFVLSGLVSESVKNNVDKVPGLGDLPIIGAFFRSTNISRTEKELIMVVTPHLVRPIAKGAAVPEMPGESISRYRPNAAETIFLESGSFGQGSDSGYSR